MSKKKDIFEVPSLKSIDPGKGNLGQQLIQKLREAIFAGHLIPGEKLPSTRSLATTLGLSRGTVTLAFDQLIAEGILEAKTGSGTVVKDLSPLGPIEKPSHASKKNKSPNELSPHTLRYSKIADAFKTKPVLPFTIAAPHGEVAMDANWIRICNRTRASKNSGITTYQDPQGLLKLREEIAKYVRRSRSVICDPDQIIITSGTQQGLYLTAKVLLSRDDEVWIEDPAYNGMTAILDDYQIKARPIVVDDEGLDVTYAQKKFPKAKAAFVTPSHQYPLGMVMSMARRSALLQWANQNNSWIVEDDYDSELRYAGHPFPSLQGLDPERVVYLGTFSKVMYPSLRLGYIILPKILVKPFIGAKAIIDRHSPTSEQQALATYMSEGYFEGHIRRIRSVYAQKRKTLIELLEKELPKKCIVQNNDQGMHLLVWLPSNMNDVEIAEKALKAGIAIKAISPLYSGKMKKSGFLLGFGAFSDSELSNGVKILKQLVK